jgi:hypothetical protein
MLLKVSFSVPMQNKMERQSRHIPALTPFSKCRME